MLLQAPNPGLLCLKDFTSILTMRPDAKAEILGALREIYDGHYIRRLGSDGGRELAAQYADVIFSRHSSFDDGQEFYADVKRRLAEYGREPEHLKIIPAAAKMITPANTLDV